MKDWMKAVIQPSLNLLPSGSGKALVTARLLVGMQQSSASPAGMQPQAAMSHVPQPLHKVPINSQQIHWITSQILPFISCASEGFHNGPTRDSWG